jgi:ubiquinone/menaquinone biosynthesis C-methylase UbiE
MRKIKVLAHVLNANGLTWFGLYLLEILTQRVTPLFYHKRIAFETKKQLPGFNSAIYNYKEWSRYDWSKGGEEWSASEQWKESLVKHVIEVFMPQSGVILEIGPGGGRWSEILARRSSELILVDLTEKAIEGCREKLSRYSHCRYFKNDGSDLSFIANSSVDFIWSFAVFVHIAPTDVEAYVNQFARILKSGGTALIHHATQGTSKEGFRSSLTNDLFLAFLKDRNFTVVTQISSWGTDKTFHLSGDDVITIFKKIE